MDSEVLSKVYWSVCIPSMLYGVDVLDLSWTQMGNVETAHKQMAKHVQGLLEHTSGSATLAELGFTGIICRKEMYVVDLEAPQPGQ